MQLWLIVAAAVLLALAAAAVVYRFFVRAVEAREEAEPPRRTVTIVLAVDGDPGAPHIARLVREAAERVFASEPDVQEVVVESSAGTILARVRRGAARELRMPVDVREPRVRVRSANEPSPQRPSVLPRFVAPEPAALSPLADAFELSDRVRAKIHDPTSLADIVRAILVSAGHAVRVAGDVLVTDTTAICVIEGPVGRPLVPDLLNHAYLRFRTTGLLHGIVVHVGIVDAEDVRRREMLAPELRHVGRDGIQRMADAAAAGADPLAFAVAPAVLTRR